MAEKKTLTLKTLTPKSGGATPNSGGGAGVSVEVRRRRFTPSAPTAQSQQETPQTPAGGEMGRRLQVLENARQNAAEEQRRRDEERQKLQQLKEAQTEDAQRKEAEEERQRLLAEQQASEAAAAKPSPTAPTTPKRDDGPRKTLSVEDSFRNKKTAGKPQGRDLNAKRGRAAYMEALEERARTTIRRPKKQKSESFAPAAPKEKVIRDVAIPEFITVQDLARAMAEKVSDVVKQLMMMGQMATATQSIDRDTATLVVEEMGHKHHYVSEDDIEEGLVEEDDKAEDLKTRPPVVTVMGHVDHGKTSLLDAIRKTKVASGEAGGITQHIGAYQVAPKDGQPITFLDTPGHAAFTSMRARGAQVTDVVILVVAADDSVMPQTIEAIQHAKAAEVPIVVAVNKVDKPEANPQKVKQDLLQHDLILEQFGGDVVSVDVSAMTGQGLDELLEMVLLQAEVLDLKANPNRRADGVIVESQLDKGRGPVATIIVQRGTLKQGDIVVAGSTWGRVRALVDDEGKRIEEAGPAMPVEILGLASVPEAGDVFTVAENDRKAKEVAQWRDQKKREKSQLAQSAALSLDNIFNRIEEGKVTDLGIVVKGDVQGSVEAITEALNKLETKEVKVKVLHGGVGVITESDVMLASASGALIVGFNVRAEATARQLAERDGIEIRYYSVIYDLIDDVKSALSGLLSPDRIEHIRGTVEIRQIFRINKVKIAGCYVTDGEIKRGSKVRLLRDGTVVTDTIIDSLRREKDDVKEVKAGFECGLTLENYDDIAEGDTLEVYEIEEIAKDFETVRKQEKEEAEEAELEKMMAEDE